MYSTESNAVGGTRLVEHGEEDAGEQLHHQHDHGDEAEEVPEVEILGREILQRLAAHELLGRKALVEPSPEAALGDFDAAVAAVFAVGYVGHQPASCVVPFSEPMTSVVALR